LKTAKTKQVFRVTGRIDQSLHQRFEDFCLQAPIHDPTQWLYIFIRSFGGDLGWSSRIVGEMKHFSAQIVTISYGVVHSSAIPIFATGTIRIAERPTDKFLFHRAKGDGTVCIDDIMSGEHSALEYVAERIKQKPDTLYYLADAETRLDALQAKELGLVHKILKTPV
jgi:ATP-dependent protease ClpP protease subunit